jgi:ribosomal protein S18 acetylase RimI-like enzyme
LDDAESLARLAERTFRNTFVEASNPTDMDLHCAKNFSVEIQRREILNPNYVTILADLEGELVAFAQVRLLSPQQCVIAERPSELYRLYVSSEWHGRGIAHEVMSEVLTTAAHGGADCVWLGVWEQNPKAIAFYRKYGFKVVGDHVFQVGTDPQRDLVMAVEVDGQSVA